MRLLELTCQRKLKATNRFRSEYAQEAHRNPKIADALNEFIRFRETARPDEQFNRKDAPYRYGDLKGFRHCHLVYGRRIVIYKVDADTIYLCALTDHSAYDGLSPKIAPFLKHLDTADYSQFDSMIDDNSERERQKLLMREMSDLAYALAADDDTRFVIEQLSTGRVSTFLEFTRLIPASDTDVARAFGTKERMMAFAQRILDAMSGGRTAQKVMAR